MVKVRRGFIISGMLISASCIFLTTCTDHSKMPEPDIDKLSSFSVVKKRPGDTQLAPSTDEGHTQGILEEGEKDEDGRICFFGLCSRNKDTWGMMLQEPVGTYLEELTEKGVFKKRVYHFSKGAMTRSPSVDRNEDLETGLHRIDLQHSFTLEFFIKGEKYSFDRDPKDSRLLSFFLNNKKVNIDIIQNQTLRMSDENGGFLNLITRIHYNAFTWNQMAFVITRDQAKIFVNGKEGATVQLDLPSIQANRFTGNNNDVEIEKFKGTLDELSIFNEAKENFCTICAINPHGIAVFDNGDYTFFHQNKIPYNEKRAHQISLTSAKNEDEGSIFSIYAEKEYENVKLTVTDLRHTKKNTIIPKKNVDLRNLTFWKQLTQGIKEAHVRQNGGTTRNSSYVPELLLYDETDLENLHVSVAMTDNGRRYTYPLTGNKNDFRVDLKSFKRSQFLVTVHVPEGTEPGIYRGYIDVTKENNQLAEIPFHVEVLNILLPDTRDIPQIFGLYYKGKLFDNNRSRIITEQRLRTEIEDQRRHGLNLLYLDGMEADARNFDPHSDSGYNKALRIAKDNNYKHILLQRCVAAKQFVNWGPYNKAITMFDNVFCYGADEPNNPAAIGGQIATSAIIHNKLTLAEITAMYHADVRGLQILFGKNLLEKPKIATAIFKEFSLKLSGKGSVYLRDITDPLCGSARGDGQYEYYDGDTLFDCRVFSRNANHANSFTWKKVGLTDETPDLSILSMYLRSPYIRHRAEGRPAQANVMNRYLKSLLLRRERENPSFQLETIYYPSSYNEENSINRFYNGVFVWLTRLDGTIPFAYYNNDFYGCRTNDASDLASFQRCRDQMAQENFDRESLEYFNDPYDDFDVLSANPGSFGELAGNADLYLVKEQYLAHQADTTDAQNRRIPTIIPTLNWELLREGIDDYRYLLALCKAMKPELSYEQCPYDREIQNILEPFLDKYRQSLLEELNQDGLVTEQKFDGERVKERLDELADTRREIIRLILEHQERP